MVITNQGNFIDYTTEHLNWLLRNKNDSEYYYFDKFIKEVNSSDEWINNFLINVIAKDLNYALYTENDDEYWEEFNRGLYEGLAYLMWILLKAEYNNAGFHRKGYFKSKFGGFKKDYVSVNELKRIWVIAFAEESFVLKDFFDKLNLYFHHT